MLNIDVLRSRYFWSCHKYRAEFFMFAKGSYGNGNVGHPNLLWICICEDTYVTQLSSHPNFLFVFFLRGTEWCSPLLSDLMALWPNWAFLDPTVMFWVGSGLNPVIEKTKGLHFGRPLSTSSSPFPQASRFCARFCNLRKHQVIIWWFLWNFNRLLHWSN